MHFRENLVQFSHIPRNKTEAQRRGSHRQLLAGSDSDIFLTVSRKMRRAAIVYSLPLVIALSFWRYWQIVLTPWKLKNSFVL